MCGLFGMYCQYTDSALQNTVLALSGQNNRGHEAVGISATNQEDHCHFRKKGFVRDVCCESNSAFTAFVRKARDIHPTLYMGHTRYSTVGPSDLVNCQPFTVRSPVYGELTFAHNGQLVDHLRYRKDLEKTGHIFTSDSDSEVLAVLVAREKAESLVEAVVHVIRKVPGAYSFLVLADDQLIAARDRYGIRPLFQGYLPHGGWAVSSEAGVLRNAQDVSEIPPGSLLVLRGDGTKEQRRVLVSERRACIFEAIYFARPDQSIGESGDASSFRMLCGEQLAAAFPVSADLVCAVPDSSIDAALGFAGISETPYKRAILKDVYSVKGRSFILPGQDEREAAARMKYSVNTKMVVGKKVVVVDDSLVRGTTIPVIVGLLREAGATEVHVRIASPPVRHPCFYGIDIADVEQLLATGRGTHDITQKIGADSLEYLSLENLLEQAEPMAPGWCHACFSGQYPIPKNTL